jgi:hypothetical protein
MQRNTRPPDSFGIKWAHAAVMRYRAAVVHRDFT